MSYNVFEHPPIVEEIVRITPTSKERPEAIGSVFQALIRKHGSSGYFLESWNQSTAPVGESGHITTLVAIFTHK